MSFLLEDVKKENRIRFTDVDISLMKDKKVIFRTDLVKKQTNAPGLIVTFPETGEYQMHLMFNDGAKQMATTSFAFSVEGSVVQGNILGLNINKELGLGLLVGGLVMTAFFVRLHWNGDESVVLESREFLEHRDVKPSADI